MALADQGMKAGLRALNRVASSDLLDRIGARKPAERLLHRAARDTTRNAARAGRAFSAASRRGGPSRLSATRTAGLFDLPPTDEQQMLQESFRACASEKLRPAALEADAESAPPKELMEQVSELGITMLGVPE